MKIKELNELLPAYGFELTPDEYEKFKNSPSEQKTLLRYRFRGWIEIL